MFRFDIIKSNRDQIKNFHFLFCLEWNKRFSYFFFRSFLNKIIFFVLYKQNIFKQNKNMQNKSVQNKKSKTKVLETKKNQKKKQKCSEQNFILLYIYFLSHKFTSLWTVYSVCNLASYHIHATYIYICNLK